MFDEKDLRFDADVVLEELVSLRGFIDAKEKEAEAEIENLLTDEQRQKREQIRQRLEQETSDKSERFLKLEKKAREIALQLEETLEDYDDLVKVIYVRPSTKWDGDKLEGYAVVHPEVLEFRSFSNPFTRIKYEG